MIDRYTKVVLTLIATALVYLCVVLTPWPSAHAQVTTRKAGEIIATPIEAVIVGWKASETLPITTSRPLPVQTERSSGAADRVVIVGWEENSARDRATSPMTPIISSRGQNIPVTR